MHLNISREFLHGAELALAHELYRVATVNAYYAMFWAAQAILRRAGIVREEWSHGGLQQAFGLEIIKKRALLPPRMGEWLNRSYRLRCDAHYEVSEVGQKVAQRVVQHANEFVTKIEEVIAK